MGEDGVSDLEPGSAPWLAAHGIDPEVWRRRECWRYDVDARPADRDKVRDAYRPFLTPGKLGRVTFAVNQSPGLVLVKHQPPGFTPIVPQLRPDSPVVTGEGPHWHYHGPWPDGPMYLHGWRPVYPPEAGERLAGRPLRWRDVLSDEEAALHVAKATGDRYDPATGFGVHYGANRDDVHKHRSRGKYLFHGNPNRVDLHPLAQERIRHADRVFFVLEGTLKNDAVLSAGEAVFSVPSVTTWDEAELRTFARAYLRGRLVLIVPDADWLFNPNVDRQAMYVRQILRLEGVDAQVAAPPVRADLEKCECKPVGRLIRGGIVCRECGGFAKGVDDWLGAGGTVDRMTVQLREAPRDEIGGWARTIGGLRVDRLHRAKLALEGLSLHARFNRETVRLEVCAPRGTIANILGVRTRAIEATIGDLAGAVSVEGSLATVTEAWDGRRVTEWKVPPTLVMHSDFRASYSEIPLGDFCADRHDRAA